MFGFKTSYRLDQSDRGGGVLLFVRENSIASLLSRHSFPSWYWNILDTIEP